jgi:hypothetical protein
MLGAKLTGSEVKYVLGLSAVSIGAAGSSAAFDAAGFSFGTILFSSNTAGGTVNLVRSATSNGTFQGWGASITGVASKLAVRSFVLTSPNTWYKLHYDNGAGSMVGCAIVALQGAYRTPVNQEATTNVFSTVLTN